MNIANKIDRENIHTYRDLILDYCASINKDFFYNNLVFYFLLEYMALYV